MWNYSFILPDFIILFTFWVYYFAHPRLPIKLNRRFLFILIVNIITVTSDVVSSLALENASFFSSCALRIFNTIFFFFFILRSLCFFLFTEDVLDLHSKRKPLLSLVKHFVFIFSELIALSNLFFDTIFRFRQLVSIPEAPFII